MFQEDLIYGSGRAHLHSRRTESMVQKEPIYAPGGLNLWFRR